MEQQYDQDPSEELDPSASDAPVDFEEEEDEPQAPRMVRIRLNGKTLEVTEEQAQIIEEHEAERQRVISRQGQELGELRQRTREDHRREPEPAPEDEDLEFFQSPSKAMAKRLQEAEERAYQRVRADQQMEQARQQYWGKFYADNKDLVEQGEVIQYLFQRDYGELKDLSLAESQKVLAAKAKAFLGHAPSQGKPLPKGPAQSERPGANPTARTTPAPQQKKSLGFTADLLAARNERRRKAKYNIKDTDD